MAFRITRRTFLSVLAFGALVSPALTPEAWAGNADATQGKRMNVLFIAVDDLRPSFGVYGGPIKTPNIDKLAARGTTFNRAYCQMAVCSPSRTSLLTGLRPDTTKIYDLQTHFRKASPDVVTLPQHFKNNGWHTQGLSKIYHGGLDDPASWSAPHWAPSGVAYHDPATRADIQKRRQEAQAAGTRINGQVLERDPKTGAVLKVRNPVRIYGPPWESWDAADSAYGDGKTAARAIELLQEYKKQPDKPFFLAVGFIKPHLPFVAPKKYYDLYPRESIQLPTNPELPKDAPPWVTNNSGELRQYKGMKKQGKPVDDEQAKDLIRGYYAATSFMDAQVGKVLDELDRLGLRENTVVVLWGDHGWQLGEHGIWTKHTNFEIATRAPLIIAMPGQKQVGTKANGLVEFVDIYPTLCAAAGMEIPAGLAGKSLVPMLNDPNATVKDAAFSQYTRREAMGYSIRIDRWRYTEWGARGAELYDHTKDPDENENLAVKPENATLIQELAAKIHAVYPEAKAQYQRQQAEGKTGKTAGEARK
jgi:arylsulfatase A-like enzyme